MAINADRLQKILATSSSSGVKFSGDKLLILRCIVASTLEKSGIVDGYEDAKEVEKGEVRNTAYLKLKRGRT